MLSLGRKEDYMECAALCEEFFRQTQYGHMSIDLEHIHNTIKSFLVEDHSRVTLLWREDGIVTGILAGQVQTIPFLNRKVATECLWWVKPSFRGGPAGVQLLDAFEYWAKNVVHADIIQMVCMPNRIGKVVERLYSRRGYKLTESTYTKEI